MCQLFSVVSMLVTTGDSSLIMPSFLLLAPSGWGHSLSNTIVTHTHKHTWPKTVGSLAISIVALHNIIILWRL